MNNVRNFGAVGDGRTKDTAAIQKAIDAGGMVFFPPGVYLSGTLYLRSNGGLELAPGAILLASPDKEDYNAGDFCVQNAPNPLESSSGAHFIVGLEVENIVICGGGRIDGNRKSFYGDDREPDCVTEPPPNYEYAKFGGVLDIVWRPSQMIFICESRNIQIRDVQLYNAPYWTCFVHGCEDVQIRGLRILNDQYSHNTDGIDIDCCCRVTISDCIIDSGDDCITLRADIKRLKQKRPCEFVTITNCVLHTCSNGIRIGVGDGIIRNVTVSNIVFHHCGTAVTVCSNYTTDPVRGVEISNISFNNLQMDAMRAFIINCQVRGSTPEPPAKNVRDIHIRQVRGTIWRPNLICGSAGKGMYDIILEDFVLDIERDLISDDNHLGPWGEFHTSNPECVVYISHADGVRMEHFKVNWKNNAAGWTYGLLTCNCRNIEKNFVSLGRPDLDEPYTTAVRNAKEATPRREVPLGVIIKSSIAVQDEGRRTGWVGFDLDGYLFLLTPDGTSELGLNKELKSADNGKHVRIAGCRTGDIVDLMIIRRKRGSACAYSFYINGMPAGTFQGSIPEKPGMPVFETSGLKATLDELGVYALADGERIVAPVSDAGVNDDRKKERKGEK